MQVMPQDDRVPNELTIQLNNGDFVTLVDSADDPYEDLRGLWIAVPHQYKLINFARGMDGGEHPDENEILLRRFDDKHEHTKETP